METGLEIYLIMIYVVVELCSQIVCVFELLLGQAPKHFIR